MEDRIYKRLQNDKVIAFSTHNASENDIIYSLITEPLVIEISSEEKAAKRTIEETEKLLDLAGIINKLPVKYREKLLRGESFEIEVVSKTYYNYRNAR